MKKFFLSCFFWFNFSYSVDDPDFYNLDRDKIWYEELEKTHDACREKDLPEVLKLAAEVANKLVRKLFSGNSKSIEDEKSYIEMFEKELLSILGPFIKKHHHREKTSLKNVNFHYRGIIENKDEEIAFLNKDKDSLVKAVDRLGGEVTTAKKEKKIETDLLKGSLGYTKGEVGELKRKAWSDRILVFPAVTVTLVGIGLLYKWFLKDWLFPPKKEELYFNFVEAVAARNRGEHYVPPKPESQMTPEEKKARDLKLAKEKAKMEERKKKEEIEKAQEKARDERLARWDKLSDEAEELDLQKFEKLHQERKEREIAEKKAKEEAEKKEKERQEKEKREQEEEDKRKKAEEKRIADAIARSMKEDEEKRKRWFGFIG